MRIIVIQTAFIGDCILTLPLINSLKKEFKCDIDVLSLPSTADIFRSCRSVSKVIEYDKKGSEKGVKGFFMTVAKISKTKYSMAFLPQRSFKSGLIAYLSGIADRFSPSRGGARFLSNKVVKYDWNEHEIDRILALAVSAGCREITKETELIIDKEALSSVEAKLGKHSDDKIIGVCSQSEWFTKCWPRERYHNLIKRLNHSSIVVVFGKERENIEGKNIINLTDQTSMKEMLALISKCILIVCNDTGPLHIAAALKKKIAAIFGPTAPPLGFTPFGTEYNIIQKELECRPCSLHGGKKCPKKHFRCMLDITVEDVEQAVYSLL